jgi:hypothetical protein
MKKTRDGRTAVVTAPGGRANGSRAEAEYYQAIKDFGTPELLRSLEGCRCAEARTAGELDELQEALRANRAAGRALAMRHGVLATLIDSRR